LCCNTASTLSDNKKLNSYKSLKQKMATIDIVLLGDTQPLSIKELIRICRKSQIFSLKEIRKLPYAGILNPNEFRAVTDAEINAQNYHNGQANFTIAILDRPLEGNYFTRPINEKVIAISIFDLDSLNIHEAISLEMYLTRFFYSFATIYKAFGNSLPSIAEMGQTQLMQEPKGCLFDICMYKPHIVKFFKQPALSNGATHTLSTMQLPINHIETLSKEIKKLKIGKYYFIGVWLKENPVKTSVISFLIGLVFSELLGNYIYDLIQNCLPFINHR
jgi:hypothetical protein